MFPIVGRAILPAAAFSGGAFPTIICVVLLAAGLASCGAKADHATAPILLFTGAGTSRGDVDALRKILTAEHLNYSTIDSRQFNALSQAQLQEFRLLIVPGGNFVDIGNGFQPATSANIRAAIQNGLNYLGICAGAFFAGNSLYNGLNLASGVRFGFYAAESRGIHKTAVAVTDPAGKTLDQYWEDGPELNGWGDVIARYPDGSAAIVEGSVGKGWVLLTGVHPEAPASWRRGMDFKTSAETDNAYAATLIRAALNRESLPKF